MSTHISEDLPRLLTGDATRDEVLAAAAHLRTCPDCQQELISAVVAHASLTSAHRFAPEIVARDSNAHVVAADEPAGPLPDMSAMFAKVRAEAVSTPARPKQRQHRLLAVAAAALVLTGGGITLAETVGSGSSQTANRTISLDAFDRGTHKAKATIVGNGTMRIDATALPRLDSGHSYEVWLTDGARQRMQSVGWIGSNNKASFSVPPKVMSQYSDIEVSVQRTNQTPYSGISVLRGAYATS